MDKRIFPAKQIDAGKTGWIVDLSGPDVVNPDCYWPFKSRKVAAKFAALVDGGMDPHEAAFNVLRRTRGTAPDTSLYLGEERRAWLKERGGIQPTINQMIDNQKGDDTMPKTWLRHTTGQVEIEGECPDAELAQAALQAGYTNAYMKSVFEVKDNIQALLPDGFRVIVDRLDTPIPASAIRVGQVRVRHGDPEFPLYVARK